jgi:hypothetical protein
MKKILLAGYWFECYCARFGFNWFKETDQYYQEQQGQSATRRRAWLVATGQGGSR